MSLLMSFDSESTNTNDPNAIFAIGAVVYDLKSGKIISDWVGRCHTKPHIKQWVCENVLPVITDIPTEYKGFQDLTSHFSNFFYSFDDIVYMSYYGQYLERSLVIRMLWDLHGLNYDTDEWWQSNVVDLAHVKFIDPLSLSESPWDRLDIEQTSHLLS